MLKKLILSSFLITLLIACCSHPSNDDIDPHLGQLNKDSNQLVLNISSDMPSIDPQQFSDTSSSRVIEDIL